MKRLGVGYLRRIFVLMGILHGSVSWGNCQAALLPVEVHHAICAGEEAALMESLESGEVKVKKLSVAFYDTSEIDLFKSGVILRQRTQDSDEKDHDKDPSKEPSKDPKSDFMVKIRPKTIDLFQDEWFQVQNTELEWDYQPQNHLQPTLSLKEKKARSESSLKVSDQVSCDQRELVREYLHQLGKNEPDWDSLSTYGPVTVTRYEFKRPQEAGDVAQSKGIDSLRANDRWIIERWILPKGKNLWEFSYRTELTRYGQDREEARRWLRQNSITLCKSNKISKTEAVLRAFLSP